MKIRPSLLLLCIAIIVLTVLVVWLAKRPAKTFVVANVPSKPGETVAATPTLPVPNAPAVVTNPVIVPTPSNVVSAPKKDKGQETLEILSTKNDVPIVFYGKVEDQFGGAISAATVNFGVRINNGSESTVKSGQMVSDGNGFFKISGYKGESLGIGVEKPGYAFVSMNGSGIYSHLYPEEQRAHPDPNNPVVIKMWKLQGAEPLMGINKTFKLPYTSEPIFFDFVAGTIVPSGGDLEVIVTRAPGSITQRKQDHRDWSIKLVPVNGGIMESDNHATQTTFEAPADGYQDSYFVQMNHDDPGWYDNIQKVFFLTSRSGQVYSKFSLDFGINDDPNGTMWFQFKGVASTNGSRNWEATVPQ